jgi:hypothetical protein
MAFGEGISGIDLFQLLSSIKSKTNLQLDVKILDEAWEPVSPKAIKAMILAINTGKVKGVQEIRLRLHESS